MLLPQITAAHQSVDLPKDSRRLLPPAPRAAVKVVLILCSGPGLRHGTRGFFLLQSNDVEVR